MMTVEEGCADIVVEDLVVDEGPVRELAVRREFGRDRLFET